jgi:hypothetical protein
MEMCRFRSEQDQGFLQVTEQMSSLLDKSVPNSNEEKMQLLEKHVGKFAVARVIVFANVIQRRGTAVCSIPITFNEES